MSPYQWTSLKKSSSKVDITECLKIEVSSHPLKEKNYQRYQAKTDALKNLSRLSAAFDNDDPLLMFAQENKADKNDFLNETDEVVDFSKVWNEKKSQILHKHTTVERLTIISSFLPHDEKFTMKQVSNLNEHVKHRLEQLDYFEEGSVKKTIGLTQQDFMTKIYLLHDELKKAWKEEQRVKAFKIAIQCSKLLSDTSVIQFYPSKFVLISDILDTFGDLVYKRLQDKCNEHHKPLKLTEEIDLDLVPESAKETCQNWLYKMASIRELLPRLYIEMSLLRCYAFLSKKEFQFTIARLTAMIRGIGNPLVATYLRVYLCKVAMKLSVDNMDCFHKNLKEFLLVNKQVFENTCRNEYACQNLRLENYLELYLPALDWLFYGTLKCNHSQNILFDELLEWCSNTPNSELFLCGLLSAFDSRTVVNKTLNVLDIVQANDNEMALTHEVLVLLGEHLCKMDSCRQISSESLIQTWWKLASNLKSLQHFLRVLEPWLEYACTHLTTKHVNFILRGTIKHMVKCGTSPDDHVILFQAVVKRIINSIPYVEEIFLMDAFMPLMELIQKSSARTSMARTILSVFFSKFNTSNQIMDHIVISSLMRLCSVLHDSITAMTFDDELKVISDLISRFVQSVNIEDDLEQQLNFYVECRSSFIKLDGVLVTLIYAVNALAVRAGASASNMWLQRACSAYCFVTVPSLRCPISKAQMYLLSGQVALLNNCIGQAEAFFKVFVGLIPILAPKQLEDGQMKCTQTKVGALFSDFLSTLLILPDNVDSNCKAYVLNGFLKSMDKLPWTKTDHIYYSTLLYSIDLLGSMAQENYIYHINSVLSNDMLYGSDVQFTQTIDSYATGVCEELLKILKSLGDSKLSQKQYNLTLELFWRVIKRGNLQMSSMASLAAKLWVLSQKLQTTNSKFCNNILSALGEESQTKLKQLLKNGDNSM